ncbi:MAG: hypothetical protein AAFO04_28935 [Cyanobacteria bacterium J06592_8]
MSHQYKCDRNAELSSITGMSPVDFCNKYEITQTEMASYLRLTRRTGWTICQPENLNNPRYFIHHLALAYIDEMLERGEVA